MSFIVSSQQPVPVPHIAPLNFREREIERVCACMRMCLPVCLATVLRLSQLSHGGQNMDIFTLDSMCNWCHLQYVSPQ